MTAYNVHVYRELRLVFEGIEAPSPEVAAAIAVHKGSGDADDVTECEGATFSAVVDLADDDQFEHTRCFDFEPERRRTAAPAMIKALREFIEADEMAEECHEWKWENLDDAFRLARRAVAEAEGTGSPGRPA